MSPELALVDADLARSARRLLPDPGDCLAARQQMALTAVTPAPRPPPERARPSGIVVLATLFVAAIIGSPAVDLLPHDSSAGPTLGVPAPVVGVSVNPSRSVRPTGPQLRWRSVPNAILYNLVLWRDGSRVLSIFPAANHTNVPARSRVGRERALRAGRYLWFVYPAYGGAGRLRFGNVIATGTVQIAP